MTLGLTVTVTVLDWLGPVKVRVVGEIVRPAAATLGLMLEGAPRTKDTRLIGADVFLARSLGLMTDRVNVWAFVPERASEAGTYDTVWADNLAEARERTARAARRRLVMVGKGLGCKGAYDRGLRIRTKSVAVG